MTELVHPVTGEDEAHLSASINMFPVSSIHFKIKVETSLSFYRPEITLRDGDLNNNDSSVIIIIVIITIIIINVQLLIHRLHGNV